jgi:alanine racemase
VKIDTGMGRLGIRFDELTNFVSKLDSLPQRTHRRLDESPRRR